jgi:hypothetical protein
MNKSMIYRAIALILLVLGLSQVIAALLGLLFWTVAGAWLPHLSTIAVLSILGSLYWALWLLRRYQK